MFVELSRKYQEGTRRPCVFVELKADLVVDVTLLLAVNAVPCTVFVECSTGQIVDRLQGAFPQELVQKVDSWSSSTVSIITCPSSEKGPEEDVMEQCRRLVHLAKVMIFIKGTPTEPRCHFSKQLVTILNQFHVVYTSFNVLSDPIIRDSLKIYSNWPTYPQLYINGELVGGLDVVKELIANGEFQALITPFTGEQPLNEKLDRLINHSRVMVFMKGTPEKPQCGFSQQLIAILDHYPQVYRETFDVLGDESVRQGLKTYVQWPTYPQLFVKGQLIGGLDIVRELHQQGALEALLNSPA